jgi:hypothetical protein
MSSLSYGMSRQHNFNSLMSTLAVSAPLIDNTSVNKYISYNLNVPLSSNSGVSFSDIDNSNFSTTNYSSDKNLLPLYNNIFFFLNRGINNEESVNLFKDMNIFRNFISAVSDFSSETDSKKVNNDFKFIFSQNLKPKSFAHLK